MLGKKKKDLFLFYYMETILYLLSAILVGCKS